MARAGKSKLRSLSVSVKAPHPTGTRIRAGITFGYNSIEVEVDEAAATAILEDEHLIVVDLDAEPETAPEEPPAQDPSEDPDAPPQENPPVQEEE